MDPNIGKQMSDVRAMLEKTTSKVSLRDLEKKGFRKVKVLRAADINQLIYKAVQTVIAKGGPSMGAAEREKIIKESQAEFQKLMKQVQEAQKAEKAAGEAEQAALKAREEALSQAEAVEQKSQQVEQAYANLESKVGQLNAQLQKEREAFEAEKAEFSQLKEALEREKQELYTKGLDAQKGLTEQHQEQLRELKARLETAEGRVSEVEGEVSAKYEARITELNGELEGTRAKLEAARIMENLKK